MDEKQTKTLEERIPIFSKSTHQILGRVSALGVYFWNRDKRDWELWTWEELEQVRAEKKLIRYT